MPWLPELFSAPVVERARERLRQEELETVPYFDGMLSGELDALIDSFAGEPLLHHPVRGRIKGTRAFETLVNETNEWFERRNASVEHVEHVAVEGGGFGEMLLHLRADAGPVDLPIAIAGDRQPDRRIDELRLYYSGWPLSGRHAIRPPLLQPDPELHEPDILADYQRALATGDVDAVLDAFEPDAYAREPAGGEHVHRGADGLRAFYEGLFSNDGGIPLEHCAVVDDGRACALEYNAVRWGKTGLPPQAGIAVYVRGDSGKLAAARIYDDVDPPLAGT